MNTTNAKNATIALAVAGLMLASATSASAAFDWSHITHNRNPDISSQLQMAVSQRPSGEVDFTFRNNDSVTPVIAGGDYNYGTTFASCLTQDSGDNWTATGTGVNFADNGTADFPSGNSRNSAAASGFDWLTVKLLMDGTGLTFAQLIDGLNSRSFHVGPHIRAIGSNKGNDSYVTSTVVTSTVPGTTTVLAGLFLLVPFGITTARFLLSRRVR